MPVKKLALIALVMFAHLMRAQSNSDPSKLQPDQEGLKAFMAKELAAASRGEAPAQVMFGSFLELSETPEAYLKAASWYQKAADQGDASGEWALGRLQEQGKGFPQDYIQALAWYRKAAEQGYAPAQISLGVLFYLGKGVQQNAAEALRWWRKAADQGEADAQVRVGAFYEAGEVVPQDWAEAAKWYRRSADQGDVRAQEMLALDYELGRGVPQDYTQAHMWLNLSAAKSGGEERARRAKMREEVAVKMSPKQLEEAQRLAREWKPITTKTER